MKARLKNFKGVAAGPELTWDGCKEIEVDFTGRTGLLAFSGENGGGKSTLLENLHHYPQLVSRGGALWQHVIGREAEKEFISTFMGHEYRSVIKMDADQGKQEGFLWVNGKPVCNGKITQYKEMINDIFGQPFTYFRSQFCPQKSKNTQGMQIENMTTGVFRELLREFLNLQKYAIYEDTAKQAGNIYQGKVAGLDQRMAPLVNLVNTEITIHDRKNEALADFEGIESSKGFLIADLEGKREKIDALKTTIQSNALVIERKKDLQTQIDRLEGELAKEKETAETEIGALGKKYREIKQDIMACDCTLEERHKIEEAADQVRELESSLVGLVAVTEEMNSDYPVQQKKTHDIEVVIANLRQQLRDAENDIESVRLGNLVDEAERAVKDREREIATLGRDPETIRRLSAIENALEKTTALDLKDPACQSTTCSFIVAALEAQDTLPELQAALEARKAETEDKRADLQSAIADITELTDAVLQEKLKRVNYITEQRQALADQISAACRDLGDAKQALILTNDELTAKRQDLARKRAAIATQKALADRLPDVRVAEQRKVDLEKQLREVTLQGTEKKAAWEARAAMVAGMVNGFTATLQGLIIDETAELSLSQTQKEIKELETVKIPAVEKEIQLAREKIATLQAELTRIETAERELETVKAQREALTVKSSQWKYLQLGCGKTGLQNLRIDGAAPRIIYNANRLLSQAYGARYAVRLETQNDAGKEDLQIKIIMENGQEVYLDDISGGQRAWNVQALWLAMSLLNQEKSGRKYDYFCSDESDGALDVENAEKYTALYRPFMAEAGLDRLVYISHKPSCRAMADHVLSFTHGKNPEWS